MKCVICEKDETYYYELDKFITFQYDIAIINAHSKCLFYMIADIQKYNRLKDLLKDIVLEDER